MEIVELTERTWDALERLFAPNGVRGCWCMFFRQTGAEFRSNRGEPNRRALRELVTNGAPVGLLAMDGEDAVGWIAVAPRAGYSRLRRSPVAKPVDANEDLTDVWSVTCFYIRRDTRRRGVTGRLLAEAVRHATARGARTIEAYPVDTTEGKVDPDLLYHGTLGMFLDAGFSLVQRRGIRRALVRKAVG